MSNSEGDIVKVGRSAQARREREHELAALNPDSAIALSGDDADLQPRTAENVYDLRQGYELVRKAFDVLVSTPCNEPEQRQLP